MDMYDVPRKALGPVSSSECTRDERRENQSEHPTEIRVVTSTAWEVGGNESLLELDYSLASQALQGGSWGEETGSTKRKLQEMKLNMELG